METYTFLRHLADSWALLVMTGIFLGVIAWAFRPGSRALHDDAAQVPFRRDAAAPAADGAGTPSDERKGADHG